MDLWQEIEYKEKQLDEALGTLRTNKIKFAEYNVNYYKVKAKRVLEMHKEGLPVTLITMLIKGDEEVNKAMFDRDCALAIADANAEAINVKKLEAKIINDQLNREWGNTR